MKEYIEKLPREDRLILQNIGKAIYDWPTPEDEENFVRIIEALRELCKCRYREAHFNLLKAAEHIMQEHGA